MSAKIRRLAVAGLMGGLLLGGAGCFWLLAGAAAGAGTVIYIDGKLVKKYDAPQQRVWLAASGAIQNLGFRVEEEAHDAAFGKIEAKRADGKSVHVEVKRLSDSQVEVSVRVGTIGNKEDAMQILDRIDKKLGQ